jgi:hypothetical protein
MPDSRSRKRPKGGEQLARFVTIAITSLFVLLGVAAAAVPGVIVASSQYLVSPVGIYAAAVIRCGIGLALLIVARGSRAPGILRVMGCVLLFMGLAMPFMGVDSARARIEWEAEHIPFLRMEGVLFVWAGFIIHKLAQPPKHQSTSADP